MRKNLFLFIIVVGIVALFMVILTTETAQKIGQEETQVAILVQEEIQIANSEESLSIATMEKGIMFATNSAIEMPSAAPGDNLVAVAIVANIECEMSAAPGDNLIVSSMKQSFTRLPFAKQEIASAAEKNSVKRYATV